jgi:hypothetical protein
LADAPTAQIARRGARERVTQTSTDTGTVVQPSADPAPTRRICACRRLLTRLRGGGRLLLWVAYPCQSRGGPQVHQRFNAGGAPS